MAGKKVALDKNNRVMFDSNTEDSVNYFWLAMHYLKDYAQMCNQHNDGIAPLPEGYGEREPLSVEQVALFMKAVLYLASVDIPGETEDSNVVEFLSRSAEYLYKTEETA
jgi:hypothetical protein